MVGDAGAVEPVVGGHVVGNRGERRDEIRHVVELFGAELRALLPLGHAVELGDLAEVSRRRSDLSSSPRTQALEPKWPRSEAVCVPLPFPSKT